MNQLQYDIIEKLILNRETIRNDINEKVTSYISKTFSTSGVIHQAYKRNFGDFISQILKDYFTENWGDQYNAEEINLAFDEVKIYGLLNYFDNMGL